MRDASDIAFSYSSLRPRPSRPFRVPFKAASRALRSRRFVRARPRAGGKTEVFIHLKKPTKDESRFSACRRTAAALRTPVTKGRDGLRLWERRGGWVERYPATARSEPALRLAARAYRGEKASGGAGAAPGQASTGIQCVTRKPLRLSQSGPS